MGEKDNFTWNRVGLKSVMAYKEHRNPSTWGVSARRWMATRRSTASSLLFSLPPSPSYLEKRGGVVSVRQHE